MVWRSPRSTLTSARLPYTSLFRTVQALSLGSGGTRIQAVVDQVGAMPAEVMRRGVTHMPPTLVLHGDRDRTVPLARARELVRLLEQNGAEHEVKIYRGEGHTFRGEAREDSIARTVDFFERSEEHTSELQSLMSISYAVF